MNRAPPTEEQPGQKQQRHDGGSPRHGLDQVEQEMERKTFLGRHASTGKVYPEVVADAGREPHSRQSELKRTPGSTPQPEPADHSDDGEQAGDRQGVGGEVAQPDETGGRQE